MARQETLFKKFIGCPVKIRYKDGKDNFSTARGILTAEDRHFVYVKGNFSKFFLNKDSIEKVSCQVEEIQDDSSE